MKRSMICVCLIAGLLAATSCTKIKPGTTDDSGNSQPSSAGQRSGPSSPVPDAGPAAPAPPPPAPEPIVVPKGTVLTVRLQQALGSKSNQAGDRFVATLAKPVVVDGKTIAPAGAATSGSITEAHAAGRFKGAATLKVALNSITIDGKSYRVQTMSLSQTSKGKGKRTATMVGGGAGGGALIGGIAGGGKGALIGGLVGAGVGTVGAAFTGKRDITLPAESAVSFQMTSELVLQPESSSGETR